MRPKILFLDDNPDRHKRFAAALPWVYTATETAAKTIEILPKGEWNYVFLDHDLGGETFVDEDREDCGMEVVRWVVENKPKVEQFFVHSHNFDAAIAMVSRLTSAGYEAKYTPFMHLIPILGDLIDFEAWLKAN